ncbi:UNKNOWN [Stylonychia lemnae]|uniref:Uncharacterized protein n=1 Tax=Stylonychia lemnae TaxID=5949 RepID=A0A078ARC0_STYLE|nr:UNKNOWN [Stylonychia lemnae]|eukprot:CDW84769.1 UNKNOWN [Stylonychia lemnae]
MGCCETRPEPSQSQKIDYKDPILFDQERFQYLLSTSFVEQAEDDENNQEDIFKTKYSPGDNRDRKVSSRLDKLSLKELDDQKLSTQQSNSHIGRRQDTEGSHKKQRFDPQADKMRYTYEKEDIRKLKPTTSVVLSMNTVRLNENQGYIEIVERRIKKRELQKVQQMRKSQRNTVNNQIDADENGDNYQQQLKGPREFSQRNSVRQNVGKKIMDNFFPESRNGIVSDDQGYPQTLMSVIQNSAFSNTHQSFHPNSIISQSLQGVSFKPQEKYIYAKSPNREMVQKIAHEASVDKLVRQLEQDKKTLEIYESKRQEQVNYHNQTLIQKQQKLRENQQFLLQQIQERQEKEMANKQNDLVQEIQIVDVNNTQYVNIYPPIRETPKEKRRFRELMQQKMLGQELDKQLTSKETYEKQIKGQIKEEQRKIGQLKKQEEDEELNQKKVQNRQMHNKYAQEWKASILLKSKQNLEDIEEETQANQSELRDTIEDIQQTQIYQMDEIYSAEGGVRDLQNEDVNDRMNMTQKTFKSSTIDTKLIEKLNETKTRLEKSDGKNIQKFKYDIEQLKKGLETCDYKSIFKILNHSNLTPRVDLSQKKPKAQKLEPVQERFEAVNKQKIQDDVLSLIGSQPSIKPVQKLVEKEAAVRYLRQQKSLQKQEKKADLIMKQKLEEIDQRNQEHNKQRKQKLQQLKHDLTDQIETKRVQSLESFKYHKLQPGIEGQMGYPRLYQMSMEEIMNKKNLNQVQLQGFYEKQMEHKSGSKNVQQKSEVEKEQLLHLEAEQFILKEREAKIKKDQYIKELLRQQQEDQNKLLKIKEDFQEQQRVQKRMENNLLFPQIMIKSQDQVQSDQHLAKLSQLINKQKSNESVITQQQLNKIPSKIQLGSSTSREFKYSLPLDKSKIMSASQAERTQSIDSGIQAAKSMRQLKQSMMNGNDTNLQLYPWELREQSVQQIRNLETISSRMSVRRGNQLKNNNFLNIQDKL